MTELPQLAQVRLALRRALRPSSRLGKTTLWFGGLAVVLQLWKFFARSPSGTMLSVWTTLVTYIFVVCLLLRGVRWARQRLLWRLRNRLIVTYVFIGVIPIVLLLSMALVAAYLFAGQFATYVALADLDHELQHLAAANDALALQLRSLMQAGKLTPQLAAEIAGASEEAVRGRTVTVLEDDKGFVIEPGGKVTEFHRPLSEAAKNDLRKFVIDDRRMHMRAVRHMEAGSRRLVVISNLPMTPELLQRAARVGSVDLYPPIQETSTESNAPETSAKEKARAAKVSPESVTIDLGGAKSKVTISGTDVTNSPQNVAAGQIAPASNRLDPEFRWVSFFNALDWQSGKELTGTIVVGSRPSMLYDVLFSTLGGTKAEIWLQLLAGIAVFLGIIELIALYIGVKLTRSMTKSVAELYSATQHVNQGDFSHRIQVRTHDQLATLEESFNSMSASLSKLMAEQKEKQRLESELAIAHEVQDLLFPRQISDLSALEVHGVCRPARTVSGDYYDFIPLRNDRLMLAVGDISGKGISAALLMATVHAFVRAYSLEPQRALEPALLGDGPANGGGGQYLTLDLPEGECAPGSLMSTLNYQLYRSTPPEKYATMFLGCYDGGNRTLTYSNAGHLPPFLVGHDGSVSRLEVSGTVVGLFDGISYSESRVPMHPGDVFVAFSDGVTEPENEFGEFGEERLIELIRTHRAEPLARISDLLTNAVIDWIGGNEQPDDVTLVLARAR